MSDAASCVMMAFISVSDIAINGLRSIKYMCALITLPWLSLCCYFLREKAFQFFG